jgi:hypothetical protein
MCYLRGEHDGTELAPIDGPERVEHGVVGLAARLQHHVAERVSTSVTTAPSAASIRATVDLPAPMPPASPTTSIRH